ncbi:MAG: hypothetical protein KGL74_06150, partial [Elusimicrobia bacterium]|nr:hypothetical protein [Elusimicrobiota bacterium]
MSGSPVNFYVAAGATYNGNVATFTDADPGTETAGNYYAKIDWGDGNTTLNASIVQGTGNTWLVQGSHAYTSGGAYTVTTTIYEVDNPSGTTINVNGTASVITVEFSSATYSANEGAASATITATLNLASNATVT